MSIEKYYQRRFGCTRNQYRRIVKGAVYKPHLDGTEEEYETRKLLIGGSQ